MYRILPILILCVIALFITDCSGAMTVPAHPGTRYVLSYTMEQPIQNSELKFRDDNIDIQFFIDAAAVTFQLQNNSDQQLSVAWDRVSFGVNRRSFSIRNNSTFYSMGHAIPQPLVVPPQGFLRETVIPWQHVYFEKGRWVEKDLFQTHDSGSQKIKGIIESSVGNEISLMLPVRIGKLVMDYSFTFKVAAANPLPSNTAPPEKERPPKPDAPVYESSIMQGYLPIFISAGILVVSIIIFTQKKAPVEEL